MTAGRMAGWLTDSLRSLVRSNDEYISLKTHLIERTRDKEVYIRVQATVALARLQDPEDELPPFDQENGGEDEDDDNEAEHTTPTRILANTMRYDTSA